MKNNNSIIKKILIIISLCIIAFLLYKIINIYAVFQSEVSGNLKMNNATWSIFVNNTDISTGTVKEFIIDEINIKNNTNTKSGKIAPGLTGDFYITINPKNTDVSIRYDLKIDDTSLIKNNIKITSIEEINAGNKLTLTDEKTYTGVIPLSNIKAGVINKIKANISWDNDETSNVEDTKLGSIYNAKLQIPVTIKVSQYLGEEITSIK